MATNNFFLNISNGIYKKAGKFFNNPYKKLGLGWFRMRLLKNAPANKLQTIHFLNRSVSFVKREDFIHSLKEIFIDDIYQQPYSPGAYIIDCGANIGLSVIYLKKLFPDARIMAFEPDEDNFELLKKNVAHFGFSNIELKREAAWIENTQLHFSSGGTLGSKIENKATAATKIVTASRLKDFLKQPVHFLKLDIEGAEYAVLKDIGDDIKNAEQVFIEYHGTFEQNEELNEILELVLANGFRYYIKEAGQVYSTPFDIKERKEFDVQLNIFCFK